MNSIVKILAFLAVAVFMTTSCKDSVQEDLKGAGASAQAIIDLGLPGGTDAVDASGNVTVSRNLTLSAGNTYVLHNYFRIQSGYTLTVEAGVTVKSAKLGDTSNDIVSAALVIERGAKIDAAGTASSPIIFTSNQASPVPGDWGGIIILGKASANIAGTRGTYPSGTNGVGFIEGLPTPNNTGRYGNGDITDGSDSDNSGTLRYVRIEYGGHVIGEGNELNGLTMGGVGSGTTLEYVEVYKGQDDGFEFFGGSVNGNHLVSALNADDDFDTDQGYSGKLQFCVVVRAQNESYLSAAPLNGSESNGDNDDDYLAEDYLTRGQFSNFTIIGPYQNDCSGTVSANYRAGAYFRDLSRLDIFNSVIVGFPNGIQVSSESGKSITDLFNTGSSLDAAKTDVRNVTIVVPNSTSAYATWNDATSANFNSTFTTSGLNNTILTATSCNESTLFDMASRAGLANDAWDGIAGTMPNLVPYSSSSLLNSADFSLLSGFTTVTYRGAFNSSTNWMSNWTKW